MKTDIEIARSIALEPIEKIAAKVAIPTDHLEHYGKYLAKVDLSELQAGQKPGKLILVLPIPAFVAVMAVTRMSLPGL